MLIANAGLDLILSLSVPVLSIIYPVAIALIALALLQRWVGRRPLVYPVTVLFTGVASVLYTLRDLKVLPAALSDLLGAMPLAEQGLGWLLPALVGMVVGLALPQRKR